MKYSEQKKDLFQAGDGYHLCHCISADFGMSAGIVVMFNKLFDMKNKMKTLHKQEGIEKWDCLQRGYMIKEGHVYNLITKRNVWEKPTYENLHAALCCMKEDCLENGVKKLAMPLIGCGIDGLEWKCVSAMVKDVFEDTDIEILVCIWE